MTDLYEQSKLGILHRLVPFRHLLTEVQNDVFELEKSWLNSDTSWWRSSLSRRQEVRHTSDDAHGHIWPHGTKNFGKSLDLATDLDLSLGHWRPVPTVLGAHMTANIRIAHQGIHLTHDSIVTLSFRTKDLKENESQKRKLDQQTQLVWLTAE